MGLGAEERVDGVEKALMRSEDSGSVSVVSDVDEEMLS